MNEDIEAFEWVFWADQLHSSRLLSRAGVDLGRWSLGVLREHFGEDWLSRAHAATKGLPPEVVRPAGYAPAFALLVTTALRLDQFSAHPSAGQVARDVKADPGKWEHATIQFEVASLMRRQGYTVSFEPTTAGDRSADLSVLGSKVRPTNVEVTRLGPADRFRHYNDVVHQLQTSAQMTALRSGVEVVIEVRAEPSSKHIDLHQMMLRACAINVALSGRNESFWCGPIETSVARGDRGLLRFQGPPYSPDSWRRLLKRIKDKIRQTEGGDPAWLRIDVADGLWQIHEFASLALEEKAVHLEEEILPALEEAPHIEGAIISSGLVMAQGKFEDENALRSKHSRGLRRVMWPGLVRETVIVANSPNSELAPTLLHAYEDEQRWRDDALTKRHLPAVRRWIKNN